MKNVYIVLVDVDGTTRSSCDVPKIVCNTEKEAKDYIERNTTHNGKIVCGGYKAQIVMCNYYDVPVKTSEGIKCKLIDRKGFTKEFTLRELIPVFRIADFKPNISYMSEHNFEISEQTCKELEFYYDYSENGIAIYMER